MSTRVNALISQVDQQVLTADGAIALQNYDQYVVVTVANITLTLPQNPQPSETHTFFSNGNFGFFVSGGAAFPLSPSDPLFVPAGVAITFIAGTTGGWQNDQAGVANSHAAAFGDGSDGSAVMDGVANFAAFSARVGSVYTLTRDAFLVNLTVNAGVTLNTGSFRLFVSGNLVNNGVITNDGNAGAVAIPGAALPAGTLGLSFAGGAGGNNGVGVAGVNATQGLAGGTGAGGAGGAGGANAGGAAGTYTTMSAAQGTLRELPQAVIGSAIHQAGVTALQGGAGGGGGGSSAVGTTGGGGGGGGGVIVIVAYSLNNAGVIRSAGGAGAAGAGAANGGGGGGGGGGDIILVTRTKLGAGTITAPGGAGGAGVNAGVAGAAGAAGNVLQLVA